MKIRDKDLERVDSYKYLDVIINETLSWSDHIEYVQNKVSQRLSLLRRIESLLPRKTREISVKSMVIPILDYADIVWGDKSINGQSSSS